MDCYTSWVNSYFGFDINVRFETILGVDDFCEYDNIVTLVCFLSYKEWLVLALENKSRKSNITLQYFIDELIIRVKIYETNVLNLA